MSPKNQHFTRLLDALKDSEIFGHMTTEEQRALLARMHRVVWKADTIKKGKEMVTNFHFVISGRLKVYQINQRSGREFTLSMLSKGRVFDVFYLLDNEVHDVHWQTIDEVEILSIPMDHMRDLIGEYPKMHSEFLRYMSNVMHYMEKSAADVSLHNTLVRLSNLLLRNINGQTQELQLVNDLPNDELAGLVGTTRAVVNRHLQELKRTGAIDVNRRHIDIKNIQKLIAIAEEKYS